MPRALANNGRAAGRLRAYVADPSCPCCDGCSLWQLLALCYTSPSCDGTPPPVLSAWICASVTCTDGSPLTPGRVVSIDGLCWTVTIQQIAVPPPGDYIISGLDPVQCVSGCDDPVCPTPTLWFPGQRCGGGQTAYFCGITQCGIYRASQAAGGGCYRVDPSGGGVVPPPGAIMSAAIEGPYAECCACENNTCRICPLMGNDAVDDPSCYPAGLDDMTCCRSINSCERLVRYRGTQSLVVGGVEFFRIINEAVNPVIDGAGVQRWQIQQTRTDFGGPPTIRILPFPAGVEFGCGLCPVLPHRAPRTWLDTDFTFGAGVWTEECNGFPDDGSGVSLTVSGWQNNRWACNGMSQDVTYTYREPVNRSITTRFEYETTITDGDEGVCSGRCFGRGVSAAKRAATASGCSGCGQGIQTTRLA